MINATVGDCFGFTLIWVVFTAWFSMMMLQWRITKNNISQEKVENFREKSSLLAFILFFSMVFVSHEDRSAKNHIESIFFKHPGPRLIVYGIASTVSGVLLGTATLTTLISSIETSNNIQLLISCFFIILMLITFGFGLTYGRNLVNSDYLPQSPRTEL